MTILDLQPKEVWKNFSYLNQCPRPSKHEEKVRAFLLKWAKERNIEAFADEIGNVIMRKPATKGMENRVGVVLQAHMDMVPQKNNDVKHDFLKDPIKPRIVGDWVYATGTTLGADDGMGVAAAMTVLESKDLQHGPIEVLITTDEETGMTGANGLKPGILKGDILLNLDSETEGELYMGCAGGMDGEFRLKYKMEDVPAGMSAFEVKVTGLKGGHSGMDIILGRGNANKIMARVLLPLLENCGCRLAAIAGGNMRNAIPREANAIICVPTDKVECAKKHVKNVLATVKAELALKDEGLIITMEACKKQKQVIAKNTAIKALRAVYAAVNGVYRMSDAMPGLVETSSNLAIVEAKDGVFSVICLIRGMVDSGKLDMCASLEACFKTAGFKCAFVGGYPGWAPNPKSKIVNVMKDVYKKLYGKEPAIMAIHAGLECAIMGNQYPNWDMVSFGPTLMSPHSPDERCYIPSVMKFYTFLTETLKNIPVK